MTKKNTVAHFGKFSILLRESKKESQHKIYFELTENLCSLAYFHVKVFAVQLHRDLLDLARSQALAVNLNDFK